MAITNFIPEFWEAQVQVPLESELVFGQPKVANRKYEGILTQQGDTVHVTKIGDPTVKNYDKTVDITVDDLSDSEDTLVIDQGKYFAFRVNDVDKVQAAGNFEDPAINRAGYKLRDGSDLFLYGKLVSGALAGNQLGRVTVIDADPSKATGTQTSVYAVAVKLREKLDRASVGKSGRYLVLPPELVSPLLMDPRFIDAGKLGAVGPLLNGQVGQMAGFDILVSNNINKVGGAGANKDDYVIVAGVSDALTYVDQINSVEAFREEKRFADVIRGLHIFGGKVFRPECIATASVLAAPLA